MLQLRRCSDLLGAADGEGGPRWAAIAAAARTLPENLPEHGSQRTEALVGAISEMLDTGGFLGRRCVTCLPAAAMRYKSIRLPRMPADELKAAVEWEATDRLHLAASKGHVQFFDAGEVVQGEEVRQEVILMAVPEAILTEHVHLLERCRLDPLAVDVVPAALARALAPPSDTLDMEAPSEVVVDVGYASTKVLIVRQGRIVFFKLIEIGGKQLDQSIASHLGLPAQEVSQLRRRLLEAQSEEREADVSVFGSTRREAVDRAVFEALRATIGELAREVGLCMRYFSVTFRGKRPERAMLVGGEAHDARLAQVLAEGASVTVERVDPLARMDLSAVEHAIDTKRLQAQWAVAAGLSMRPQPRALSLRKGVAA
jgi:type IV pilus assembly protein PilM